MDHALTYALMYIIFKRFSAIRSIKGVRDIAHLTVDHPESSRPYKLLLTDDMLHNFDSLRMSYEKYTDLIPQLLNAPESTRPWRLTPVYMMVKALVKMPQIKRLISI